MKLNIRISKGNIKLMEIVDVKLSVLMSQLREI